MRTCILFDTTIKDELYTSDIFNTNVDVLLRGSAAPSSDESYRPDEKDGGDDLERHLSLPGLRLVPGVADKTVILRDFTPVAHDQTLEMFHRNRNNK